MASTASVPPTRVSAGSTLGEGRYVVTRLLGEGSQGQTLEAIDKRDGQLVAIKRFSIRGAASWKDVELAEREARVLGQLDHPALPKHLAQFEDEGALLLVMSLVEGEDLATKRERGQLFSTVEVMQLLWQMGGVLTYLHNRAPPVIHRDIKPRNIIQRPDGTFALVDFGSVRDRLKADGSTVVGTFGFMAPEQFQGRALPVTDVYGLGATALVLLTGTEPEDQPHQGLAIDVKAALGAGADQRVVRLLSSMLHPNPDSRLVHLQPALEHLFQQRPDFFSGVGAARGAEARRTGGQHEQADSRGSARPTAQEQRGAATPPSAGSDATPNQRGNEFWGGPLLVVALMLVLWTARFATWALMRFSVPLLLIMLSLFFGDALRKAAKRVRDVGERSDEGLRRASRRFRTGGSPEQHSRPRQAQPRQAQPHQGQPWHAQPWQAQPHQGQRRSAQRQARSAAPPPPNPGSSAGSRAQAERAERARVDAWPNRGPQRATVRGKARVIETELEELEPDPESERQRRR